MENCPIKMQNYNPVRSQNKICSAWLADVSHGQLTSATVSEHPVRIGQPLNAAPLCFWFSPHANRARLPSRAGFISTNFLLNNNCSIAVRSALPPGGSRGRPCCFHHRKFYIQSSGRTFTISDIICGTFVILGHRISFLSE